MLKPSLLKPSDRFPGHEELFLQRYELLRGWALKLTAHDPARAEDLLQDAFIHFTLSHPPLDQIQSPEAYLYTMLRNLHLSEARRLARSASNPLSMVDYDSAEIALQAADPRDHHRVRDELRAIVSYACARKESAKAGSILILRFFHGYYPEEIALIGRTSRSAVENQLQLARSEARLYLTNPQALAFIKTHPEKRRIEFVCEDDIFESLRRMIFQTCGQTSGQTREDDCFSGEQIEAMYASAEDERIGCAQLSHLVSCPRCLDEVNRRLGLPLLAERHAVDTIGPDRRSKGGGQDGGGTGSASGFLRQSRRRVKEVIAHRPQELHISVNGFILGAQKIGAELNDLTLNVNVGEAIGFVEVFSERDVRLLFLPVAPPPEGAVEQSARVALNDGRTLEARLNFSAPWPQLRAIYYDPLLKGAVAKSPASISETPAGILASAFRLSGEQPETVASERLSGGFGRIFARLRQSLSEPRLQQSFWQSFRMRTGAVAVLLAICFIAVFLLARRSPAAVSAAEILHRSKAAEAAAAGEGMVLHRTLNLEERRNGGAASGTRQRIEIWQSGEKGIRALRVYDEMDRLIAGAWSKADGSRTIYQRGRREVQPESQPAGAALSFDEAWQWEPSAEKFTALVGGVEAAMIEERSATYVIHYQRDRTSGEQGLVRATLTLRRGDLHPIELTLVAREAGEEREYRMVEASFERRPARSAPPDVFDPEPILFDSPLAEARPVELESLPEEIARLAESDSSSRQAAAMRDGELEVEALALLNKAGADLGEQVSVKRTTDGFLRVEAMVETEQRKRELLEALRPIAQKAQVRLAIRTVDEAQEQEAKNQRSSNQPSSGAIIIQQVEVEKNTCPACFELNRHFARVGQQPEEAVRRFADQMLDRSSRLLQYAWAIRRLKERFSAEELRAISPEARSQWLGLIRSHAHSLEREAARMRQALEPIFFPGQFGEAEKPPTITDHPALEQSLERLFASCVAVDRAMRSAFATSTEANRTSLQIKESEFWRSLGKIDLLAAAIQSAR